MKKNELEMILNEIIENDHDWLISRSKYIKLVFRAWTLEEMN